MILEDTSVDSLTVSEFIKEQPLKI